MKKIIAAVLVVIASNSIGWSQISDISQQERIIYKLHIAQKVQAHRQQMASQGDSYVIDIEGCSEVGSDCRNASVSGVT